jgi:hypothetical protein
VHAEFGAALCVNNNGTCLSVVDSEVMNDATAASDPRPATKLERWEFIKQSVDFSEGIIRAYDTKAQISLAAFVLSLNPLLIILNNACPGVSRHAVMIMGVAAILATISLYLFILWPVRVSSKKSPKFPDFKALFYLLKPKEMTLEAYLENVREVRPEAELAGELLVLAQIRTVKARRFKTAIVATFLTLALLGAIFLYVRECAAL